MLIVFSNGREVIVTPVEGEAATIKEYFTDGGRDLDNYDREEIDDGAVMVSAQVFVG